MTLPEIKLATLISEDLRGAPGPVLTRALVGMREYPADPQPQLDACLAALMAGEAKRALGLLADSLQTPRLTAALTAWAKLINGNRYPGGVGAETSGTALDATVSVSPGPPLETLVEHIVAYGPPGLATVRTMIEFMVRLGDRGGVQQTVATGISGLQALGNTAIGLGYPAIAQWATLAGADLFHRAGMPEWEEWLRHARGMAAEPAQHALTFLVEGDWHAAPGSSLEAMGLELAPRTTPSPLGTPDLEAAGELWERASTIMAGASPPAMAGALALRRAFMARAGGDSDKRRAELDAADEAYLEAGDIAAVQLARIHRVIADIDDYRLGGNAVTELIDWAATVGSTSWSAGLGRLLERTGAALGADGSKVRARVANLAALRLAASGTKVDPSRALVTAVASADSRFNLSTNALLRLERQLGDLFENPDDPDPFAFTQRLEASYIWVGALRALSGGPRTRLAADLFDRLRAQLAAATQKARSALPEGDAQLPLTLADLQYAIASQEDGDTLEEQVAASERGFQLMLQMQLGGAQEQLDLIDVLAPMCRAAAARLTGREEDARAWGDAAVEAARKPGSPSYLLPLALVSAQRLEEARAALATAREAGTLPDEFTLPIAQRAQDLDAASAALGRLVAAGWSPTDWPDLLSRAELELHTGNATAARTIESAILDFEASVRQLARDPERVDACDRADIPALYSVLALTQLANQDPQAAQASIDTVERLHQLTAVDTVSPVAFDGGRAWRLAAASYSAAANSLLAVLPTASTAEKDKRFAELDAVGQELTTAELTIDAATPGVLLRRTAGARPPSIVDLQARMPEDALLLEYLLGGEDLISWGVTRDDVNPHTTKIRNAELASLVRAFHQSCSSGRAVDSRLAEILLAPFTDLLGAHRRIVVVPFGPLWLVPFHALKIDGRPLGFSHTVSYATRAASVFTDGFDAPAKRRNPLIIGDPAFDPAARRGLKRLPGAAAEAHTIAQLLSTGKRPLVGPAATEAAIDTALDGADLLHVASHGHLDELSPFASALVLSGSDEITVAELAGMQFQTDLAVLTGCDTGRGLATLGGPVVGLTRALLRSGVRRAIVSLWPVDDAVAPVLMRTFYASLAADSPPADALAIAQQSLAALTRDALRDAYIAMGGDPRSARSRRRGVSERDKELIDDEEMPDALGGDAERYWAPFILVT